MKASPILFCALIYVPGMAKAEAQPALARQVSGFSGVANAGSFAVHIRIDGTESLKIVGADAGASGEIEVTDVEQVAIAGSGNA